MTQNGFKDATADPTAIRSFWPVCSKGANVAIATGPVSGLLVVDVDPRNGGAKSLAELEAAYGNLARRYVVATSEGGVHMYFRLPPNIVIPSSQLRAGIDIKADGGYVVAPPSVHPSGHVYRPESSGEVPLAPEWLVAMLVKRIEAPAHVQSPCSVDVDTLRISSRGRQLIRDGVPEGQRSENLFGVVRAMVNAGYRDEDIIDVMMNPAHGLSDKPIEKGLAWLKGEIKRARVKDDLEGTSHTANNTVGASANPLRLLSVEDLRSLPPPEWLLQDRLLAGSLAFLYGPPGAGKSFLALAYALGIATGCGGGIADPRKIGPVVYIAAEGIGGLLKRVQAWEIANDQQAENIYFVPGAVNLINEAAVGELTAAIQPLGLSMPPRLIVIDTMARCLFGSDENSSQDMGRFIGMVDAIRLKLGCAVLVIHHSTKADPKTDRGSSALRGAADTMLRLEPGKEMLRLSCEKQKDAAEFELQHLRLQVVEIAEGDDSCVIRPALERVIVHATASFSPHEESVLQILGRISCACYTELLNEFSAETGRSKRTFDRALSALSRVGQVVKDDESGRYTLARAG